MIASRCTQLLEINFYFILRYPSLGRKYIGQVCENIMEKLAKKLGHCTH